MIDLQDLRSRPEAYQKACDKKRIKLDISAFLKIDDERRAKVTEVETLRASQKSMSKEVPSLKGDEGTKKREELKILSSRVKELENNLDETLKEWNRLQLLIPSIPVDEVPNGKDDSENVEFKRVGEIPQFSFKPKDHVEIGEALKLFDVERGVKLAGSRSYFLTGMGARLQHAVLSLALDFIAEKGYTIMEPPHIVNYKAMMGTGYFPGGEDMAYHLDQRDDESYLIGTSEVPVAAYHLDETLNHAELPKRYSGYSPCYRREAGTYGKDTRGLYRVHQFYKVEQVVICENNEETSRALHNELLGNAEELLTLLELPYRVVVVCTGDMGQGQVWKHDIETWMPSRNAYSETHSCSTLHDFQARRLNLKYRDQSGKSVYCHTLNNTLIASPRVLIPLIENHQLEDGSIRVPKALQKYLGGLTKIG
jgi:seryl-tRNA synthetase